MKIAIFGAGAIGGLLGVKLHQAGADVTFIARGPHLAAMQAEGVTLVSDGQATTVCPRCVADPADAGEQDYVFVTLKAHSLPAAAGQIASLMGRRPRWSPGSTACRTGISMASIRRGAIDASKAWIQAVPCGRSCRRRR